MSLAINLLNNANSTGQAARWPGGRGTFSALGTFGGATVKLQYLGADNVTYIDVGSSVTFTAAGVANFELAEGTIIATVVGGAPSGLYATAAQLPVR